MMVALSYSPRSRNESNNCPTISSVYAISPSYGAYREYRDGGVYGLCGS